MEQPDHFYQKQLKSAHVALSVIRMQALFVSLARLLVFALTVWIAYLFRSSNLVLTTTILVGIILFLYLVSVYTNLRNRRKYLELFIKLNQDELKALEGDYSAFSNGSKYADPQHAFSYDMDVFGNRSFFQAINRTGTVESETVLAAMLTSNQTGGVLKKQEAIRELVTKPEWCLKFRTHQAMQTEPVDQVLVTNAMTKHVRLLPAKGALLAVIYSGISLVLILLVSLQILPGQVILIPLLIGLLISGFFLRHVSKISQQSSNLAKNFRHISETLELIESEKWESELLRNAAGTADSNSTGNSKILVEFSKILAALDQRNNIFFALVANGLFLWDLRHGSRAEQWILANAGRIATIFKQVNAFDAQVSFGTYAFTHPDYKYPQLSEKPGMLIEATAIGHPLIARSKCVTNSFSIKQNDFFVITGANMAGKSTFLRTVGISLVMANCGLPVFADAFHYKPVRLISSMRSSDSLVNDESYFFAELKRLKFIVDEIQNQPYFIILDEILKGTNSKDKELGSKKFLTRLSASGSSGLIATHDLSLCDLSETNNGILNYYFDAEIENDELHFDYRFKTGICQNMNASFLLRKMKIVE